MGPPFIYDYEAVIKETEQIEPLTKVYNQEGLEDGVKMIEEGAVGIRVVIERQKRKGMFIETFARLKDYYPPYLQLNGEVTVGKMKRTKK